MTMTPHSHAPGNSNYRQVLRGYLRLHQLTVERRDESVEADAVRDALDLPWHALTVAEKERVQGLSADLFEISEPTGGVAQGTNPQAQKNLTEALEAKQRGEWERTLELLRRWGKHIAPALVSYLRGGIWVKAGYPEIGVVFYEHAAKLDPDNANYAGLVLNALESYDLRRALEMSNRILETRETQQPSLVVLAAGVAFGAIREIVEPDAIVALRALIPILEDALPGVLVDEMRSVYLMALMLLALSHEHLGETGAAFDYYSMGLRIEPSHDALLTGRGILTYGKSPQSPSDLEQAVKLGSPLVWPYFFLAHHYIANNRYEDCRRMCEKGLAMTASLAVHSQLSEWLAIAEAELGFPSGRVRAAFEQALRLDPSNDTARRNLDTFERASPRPTVPKTWEKRSESNVRVFGQAERRLQLAA